MDEKQEHIITMTEKIFVRYGFRKTTVDEIAKAAGMGKSTLYYYFKSKEAIFAAVIRRDAQFILEKLNEAIKTSPTPQEQFRNYVRTRMTVMAEMSSHYDILKGEYLDLYPLIEQERRQLYQYELDTVTGILQQGVRQGVFTLVDVAASSKLVLALLRGFEELWFIREQAPFHLEHALNILLSILSKGIETR